MLMAFIYMTSAPILERISTMVMFLPSGAYSSAVSQAERPPPQMTTFLPSGMPFLWICSTSMAFSMPGMAGRMGLEPGGHEHGVRGLEHGVVHADLGVQHDLDAELLELDLVPLDELRDTPLEVAGGNGEEGAAQAVGLLIEGDGAAALGSAPGRLETARGRRR